MREAGQILGAMRGIQSDFLGADRDRQDDHMVEYPLKPP